MKNVLLILSSIFYTSCWFNPHHPAISSNYNFKNVGSLIIDTIEDYSESPKSGMMIFTNLTHNFLKLGYEVNQSSIRVGNGKEKIALIMHYY